MNEASLSNDLNVITAEIKTWKSFAGMSVWEIGKRIKHVKENNLTHGNYIPWLEEIGMDRTEAYRYTVIADELPNDDTWQHLSSRALYLITTLPEEQKQEQIEKINDGYRPTVKEIENIKKENAELKRQAEQAKRSEQLAIEQLEREQNKEPEVVTQTVERVVVPDDYKDLERKSRDLEAKVFQMNKQLERIKEIDSYEEKAESIKQEVEYLNGERQKLKHIFDSAEKLQQLEREFNQFFDEKMAPLKYKPLINNLNNTNGVSRMKGMVNLARAWVEDMDNMLPADNRQIIEGEIIND